MVNARPTQVPSPRPLTRRTPTAGLIPRSAPPNAPAARRLTTCPPPVPAAPPYARSPGTGARPPPPCAGPPAPPPLPARWARASRPALSRFRRTSAYAPPDRLQTQRTGVGTPGRAGVILCAIECFETSLLKLDQAHAGAARISVKAASVHLCDGLDRFLHGLPASVRQAKLLRHDFFASCRTSLSSTMSRTRDSRQR